MPSESVRMMTVEEVDAELAECRQKVLDMGWESVDAFKAAGKRGELRARDRGILHRIETLEFLSGRRGY